MLNDIFIESLECEKGKQKDYYDPDFKSKGSFGIRVGSGGTKTFFLLLPLEDKRKRVNLGRFPELTANEARSIALKLIKKNKLLNKPGVNFDHKNKSSPKNELISFHNLADKFIHFCTITGKSKENTIKEYKRILHKEILPHLGPLDLRSIKRIHIQEIYEDILFKRKKKVLANRVRALIHRIFEFSVERELRQTNPASRIKKFPEKSSKSKKLLTLDEIIKIYDLLNSKNSQTANALIFSIISGQNIKKVCQLKWSDMIQDRWRFRINDSFEVLLPLSDLALTRLSFQFETKARSPYVFYNKTGEPLRFIEKSIRAYGEESKLETQLTGSLIFQSIKELVIANMDKLTSELEEDEVNTFFYPDKINKFPKSWNNNMIKQNHAFKEIGIRPAVLIENILLNKTLDIPGNLLDTNPDSSLTKTNEPIPDNVVFVPKDIWKNKKR